jgi:hypothetical protein
MLIVSNGRKKERTVEATIVLELIRLQSLACHPPQKHPRHENRNSLVNFPLFRAPAVTLTYPSLRPSPFALRPSPRFSQLPSDQILHLELHMEHLRQIEEDLRSISAESKESSKRYPEVVDAADRALGTLKSLREAYLNNLRKTDKDIVVKLPASPDLLSPYILLCNYSDCSPRLTGLALSSLMMLLNYDVIPVEEAQNILRVLLIQVNAGKADNHLKVLQITLQLAALATRNQISLISLGEQAMTSLMSILIHLCEGKQSPAVFSAAMGTLRQVVALFMDRTSAIISEGNEQSNNGYACCVSVIIREVSSLLLTAGHHSAKYHGLAPCLAVDVLHEVLETWRPLLQRSALLKVQVRELVFPAAKILLKSLKYEYVSNHSKAGGPVAIATASKAVNLARLLLLKYCVKDWTVERDILSSLLIDGLQPIREFSLKDIDSRAAANHQSKPPRLVQNLDPDNSLRSKFEEASALIIPGGASSLLSKFSSVMGTGGSTPMVAAKAGGSYDRHAFMIISNKHATGRTQALADVHLSPKSLLAVYPTACCLSALIAFVSTGLLPDLQQDIGLELKVLGNLMTCCSSLIMEYVNLEGDFRCVEPALISPQSGLSPDRVTISILGTLSQG